MSIQSDLSTLVFRSRWFFAEPTIYVSDLLSAWISSYNGGRSTCIIIPLRCSYSVYPGKVVLLLALLVVRAKLRASAKGFGSANGFE